MEKRQKHRNKSFASLPVILLIGGMLVEIGVAGAFVAYFLGQSGFGIKLSQDALAAAQAGIQDALIRIVRDTAFNTGSTPYSLAVGNNTAQITVCKDKKSVSTTCDTSMVGKSEIISLGVSANKQRRIQAIININSLTGEVKVESEKEIAL